MRLLVVSDLHISGPKDPLYDSLLALIRQEARSGDTLVLAGDLFDLFVGDKAVFTERYHSFVEALREAADRGVRAHYIEGNHDFLIKRAFRGIRGLEVHAHDVRVKLRDKKFFIAHGDTVDQADYKYRALRLFFRSPLIRAFVKTAPGEWIDRIGQASSRRSRQKSPRTPNRLPIERLEYLRKTYRNFAVDRISEGYDFVILGHCHDLDEMSFNIGGRPGQYINVGYPRVHRSFLIWTPDEEKIYRKALP